MSIDLFFVSRTPAFDRLRADDFKPTPAQIRTRRKVVAALLEAHSGTTLQGDAMSGYLEDFPFGQLILLPGAIHWSLHHVEDASPIQAIVDGFLKHGLVCEDVQDAGFGNRQRKTVGDGPLASFDQLVGARFLGVRLDRQWGSAITLEWTLDDGRYAQVFFVHFVRCELPELSLLVNARVAAVEFISETLHDTLRVRFEEDCHLLVEQAVLHKTWVSRKAPSPA